MLWRLLTSHQSLKFMIKLYKILRTFGASWAVSPWENLEKRSWSSFPRIDNPTKRVRSRHPLLSSTASDKSARSKTSKTSSRLSPMALELMLIVSRLEMVISPPFSRQWTPKWKKPVARSRNIPFSEKNNLTSSASHKVPSSEDTLWRPVTPCTQ